MELKEKIDLLHKIIDGLAKQSDVYHKKVFILLALLGGLGTVIANFHFAIEIKMILIFLFFIFTIGITSIYFKLSEINVEINELLKELKRIKNDK